MALDRIKQAIVKRVKDFGDSLKHPVTGSISDNFWNSRVGNALVSAQEMGQTGKVFGTYDKPQNLAQAGSNAVAGVGNNLLGRAMRGGNSIGQNISDIGRYYFGGDLASQPEFRSQGQIVGDSVRGLADIGAATATAYGAAKYLPSALAISGLGGGIKTAINRDPSKNLLEDFTYNTLEEFPRSVTMAGITGPTQPLMDKAVQGLPWYTRLPSKSGLNILQGGLINASLEKKILDPVSIAIDGLFPIVSEGVGYVGHRFKDKIKAAIVAGDEKQLDDAIKEVKSTGAKVDKNAEARLKDYIKKGGQQAVQDADLTAYEKALNSGDDATVLKVAARHGDDARFNVHQMLGIGDSTQAVAKSADTVPPFEAEARKVYGLTKNPKEAFFIAKNGEMIDGSGYSLGGSKGSRTVDHGEITSALEDSNLGGVKGMYDYMDKTDNIRFGINGNEANIDVVKRPSDVQIEAIKDAAKDAKMVYADITDPYTQRVVGSRQFDSIEKWADWVKTQKFGAGDSTVDLSKRPDLKPGFWRPFAWLDKSDNTAKDVEVPKMPPARGAKPTGDTVEQTFRGDKFDLDPEQTAKLDTLRKTLGFSERQVRTFDDMRGVAEDLGANPGKLLQDIQTGRITDSEIVALGDTIASSSERIANLTKQLEANPADEATKLALDQEQSLISQALAKRIKGGTEAGRAVVAFRIIANKTLNPVYWLDKAQRQLGDGATLKPEDVTAINDLIQQGDRLGLASYVSMLGESSLKDKAITLWKAGLLTGFRTHEANIASNAAFGTLENIKDIPATLFDMGRATITGGPRAKAISPKILSEEIGGFGEGARLAKDYLANGIDPTEATKVEVFKPTRYGDTRFGKLAQKYTDTVFRTLGAEDKLFRQAAFKKSIAEQATVEGINRNLSTDEIQNLMRNPTEEMLELAKKEAAFTTFNNPNAIANGIRAMKQAGGETLAGVIDFIAPFTRTPTNVAARAVDYTPVGFLRDTVRKIINSEAVTDRQLADAFGRSVTGSAIIGAGYWLAKNGRITGATPSSESERNQFYLEGKQPNAVLINGKWRSIGRISPVGNLLVLGGELYKTGGDLVETGISGVKSLTEMSFLKGVSSALGAVNDPRRGSEKYIEGAASGTVPTIVRDIARGTDDSKRDPEGALEAFKVGIPGLRQSVHPLVDPLGDNVKEEGGLAGALFDPTSAKKENDDPIVKEMSRVGYNLNKIGEKIGDTQLSREQEIEYQRLAGKYIKEMVAPIIESEGYKQSATDIQQTIIERTVNAAKERAREELKPKLESIGPSSGYAAEAASEDLMPEENAAYVAPTTEAPTEGKIETKSELPDMYNYWDGSKLHQIDFKKYNKEPKDEVDAIRIDRDKFRKAIEVFREDGLKDEEKEKILDKLKVDPSEVRYYDIASDTNEVRRSVVNRVMDMAGSDDRASLIMALMPMRREVAGQRILTDSVIDDLYNDDQITKEEKAYLKSVKFKNGQVVVDQKKSSGSKGKALKFRATNKLGSGVGRINLNLTGSAERSPVNFRVSEAQLNELRNPKIAKLKQ